MTDPITDTETGREIVGTIVNSRHSIEVGDQLAVLAESSNRVRVDLETDTGHREPLRLIAWIAITGSVSGTSGVDRGGSYDNSHLLGSWIDSGSDEAIPVRLSSGSGRINTYSLRGDTASRQRCQIRIGSVVVRVRPA